MSRRTPSTSASFSIAEPPYLMTKVWPREALEVGERLQEDGGLLGGVHRRGRRMPGECGVRVTNGGFGALFCWPSFYSPLFRVTYSS